MNCECCIQTQPVIDVRSSELFAAISAVGALSVAFVRSLVIYMR
jgi:hypothetical protein